MKRIISLLLVLALLFSNGSGIFAAYAEQTDEAPEAIEETESRATNWSLNVSNGGSGIVGQTLSAYLSYSDSGEYIWTSSDTSVFQVIPGDSDSACTLSLVGEGTATLSVTDGSLTQEYTIEALDVPILEIGDATQVTLAAQESTQFALVGPSPDATSYTDYVAYVSDTLALELDYANNYAGDAQYTAEGNAYMAVRVLGFVILRVTNKSDETVTETLSVAEAEAPSGISFNPETITGQMGQTVTLGVEYSGESPLAWAPVRYSVSDSSVISIWNAGNPALLYLEAEGTATVTATCGDLTASCEVTVTGSPEIQENEAVTVGLCSNQSTSYLFTPSESGYYTIHVAASSEDGGFYPANLTVSGLYPCSYSYYGETYSYIYLEQDQSYTLLLANGWEFDEVYTMSVYQSLEPESVNTDASRYTLYLDNGSNTWVGHSFSPMGAFAQVTWVSSDPTIADVVNADLNGFYVQGYAEGTVTLSAMLDGQVLGTCQITVTNTPIVTEGETTSVSLWADESANYFFTPATSGTYMFTTPYTLSEDGASCTYFYVQMWDNENHDYPYSTSTVYNDTFYTYFQLEAGVLYELKVSNYSDMDLDSIFTLSKAPEVESLDLGTETVQVAWTGTETMSGISATVTPADAWTEFNWSTSNEDVLRIDWADGLYCQYVIVGPGTATLTLTAGDISRSVTFEVATPLELALDNEVSATIPAYSSLFYTFTPSESGYYTCSSPVILSDFGWECTLSFSVTDGSSDCQVISATQEDGTYSVIFWLEAGTQYTIRVANGWEFDLSGSFTITKSLEPESLTLSRTQQTAYWDGVTDSNYGVNATFSPTGSTSSITWTSSNEDVAFINYTSNNYCGYTIVGLGETVITATAENGMTASLTVTVLPTPTVEADTETSVEVPSQDSLYFNFTPSQTGYYGVYTPRIQASDDYPSCTYYINIYESDGMYTDALQGIYSETAYTQYYKLTAGTTYKVQIGNGYEFSLAGSFTIQTLPQPESLEMSYTEKTLNWDGITYYGSALQLSFLPSNAYSVTTWTSSDESVLQIFYSDYNYCSYQITGFGTATITATTENGVSATATIHVEQAPELAEGEQVDLTLTQGQEGYYRFIPSESGYYTFSISTYTTDGNWDAFNLAICDSNGAYVNTTSHWPSTERLFYAKLNAGETYALHYYPNWIETGITCTISAFPSPDPTSVKLDCTSVKTYYRENDYQYLYYSLQPTYAMDDVTVTISDESVLALDYTSMGYISLRVLAPGSATVTISAGSACASCVYSILERPTLTSMTLNDVTGFVGSAFNSYVYVTASPEGALANCEFTVEDPTIATVVESYGSNCYVKPLAEGTTTLTAVDQTTGVTATCTITAILPGTLVLDQEQSITLAADGRTVFTFTPETSGRYVLTTSSYLHAFCSGQFENFDEDSTRSENNTHLFLNLDAGNTYMFYVDNYTNKERSSTVCLSQAVETVESMDLTVTECLDVTGAVTMLYVYASYDPVLSEEAIVQWTSSDTEVLALLESYDHGAYFTLKGSGTATITAVSENGLTASATYTAQPTEAATSGACGENLTWELSEDGTVLTISGTGDMDNYEMNGAPWIPHYQTIQTVILEEGVTSIGAYAFSDMALLYCTEVRLADTITSIGTGAFLYNSSLSRLDISANVTTIGTDAFGSTRLTIYCPSGSTAEVYAANNGIPYVATEEYVAQGECGDDLTWTLDQDGTLQISGQGQMYDYSEASSAYVRTASTGESAPWSAYADQITNIQISQGVTSIGSCAFSGLSNVSEVTIPEQVTSIGEKAFSGCESLTQVDIPTTVETIEAEAFSGCSEELTLKVEEVEDGETSSAVEAIATYNAYESTTVSVAVSVNATSGTGEDGLSWTYEQGKLTITGAGAMADYSQTAAPWSVHSGKILSVAVDDGVTSISAGAFDGLTRVTGITIPASVENIDLSAFDSCAALSAVAVASGSASYRSFSGLPLSSEGELLLCPQGKTLVTLTSAVKHVGTGVLANANLKNVIIDDSFGGTIDTGAFHEALTVTGSCLSYAAQMDHAAYGVTIRITHQLSFTAAEEATCTESGSIQHWHCFDCGKYYADEAATTEVSQDRLSVAPKGHTEVIIPGKEATCTEDGLTDGKICSVCGVTLAEQVPVAAKGHTETILPGKDATCTEEGLTAGKICSVCGTVIQAQTVLPALGHRYEGGKCAVCGAADPDYLVDLPFTDVTTSNWFYPPVQYLYSRDIITGITDTTFVPNDPITRAQVVIMLYRMEGSPEVTYTPSFSDVPDGKWYTDAVIWASQNGIVNGKGDGTFDPNGNILRQELIAIIYRYAGSYKGMNVSARADLSGYTDRNKVQSYAMDAFQWGVATTIINGMDATTLAPRGTATRAQFSKILYVFMTQVQ